MCALRAAKHPKVASKISGHRIFFRLKFALIVEFIAVAAFSRQKKNQIGAAGRGVINCVLEPYEDIQRGQSARALFSARARHTETGNLDLWGNTSAAPQAANNNNGNDSGHHFAAAAPGAPL